MRNFSTQVIASIVGAIIFAVLLWLFPDVRDALANGKPPSLREPLLVAGVTLFTLVMIVITPIFAYCAALALKDAITSTDGRLTSLLLAALCALLLAMGIVNIFYTLIPMWRSILGF